MDVGKNVKENAGEMENVAKITRNPWVDILRFIFALCIVFFHNETNLHHVFCHGDISVLFFFALSGFYALRSIQRHNTAGITYMEGCASFFKRKLLAFHPEVILSVIARLILVFFLLKLSIGETVSTAIHYFISDVLLLRMTGLETNLVTYAWYLSTMMLALLAVYPIYRKYGSNIYLLCAGLVLLGILRLETGTLTPWPYHEIMLVYAGNFEGLGMILLGGYAVSLSPRFRAMFQNRFASATFLWSALLLFCLLAMNNPNPTSRDSGGPEVLCGLAMFLLVAVSDAMPLPDCRKKIGMLVSRICVYLGKLSLPLYLIHICTHTYFEQVYGKSYSAGLGVLYVMTSILAAMLLVYPSDWLRSKISRFYR